MLKRFLAFWISFTTIACGNDEFTKFHHGCKYVFFIEFRIPLEQVRVPLKHRTFYGKPVSKNINNFPSGPPQQLTGDLHIIPLENHYDMVYVSRVVVGSGPKKKYFKALIDSGSSDVWFISTQCSSDFCHGREAYHFDSNLTREASKVSIGYAAGRVYGYSTSDRVRLKNIGAKNQGFVAASSVTISVQAVIKQFRLTNS
jgi:hypothetical protein